MPKSFIITQLLLTLAILLLAAAQTIPFLGIICSDVVSAMVR